MIVYKVGDRVTYRRRGNLDADMACYSSSFNREGMSGRVTSVHPTRRSDGGQLLGVQWDVDARKNNPPRYHSCHFIPESVVQQEMTAIKALLYPILGDTMFNVVTQRIITGTIGQVVSDRSDIVLWQSEPFQDDDPDMGPEGKTAVLKATLAAREKINAVEQGLFSS